MRNTSKRRGVVRGFTQKTGGVTKSALLLFLLFTLLGSSSFFCAFAQQTIQDEEYINPIQGAFLRVSTNQQELYTRQSLEITIALYIPKQEVRFFSPKSQHNINELYKLWPKLRIPTTEKLDLEFKPLTEESTTWNGKDYSQYLLYKGILVPTKSGTLTLPKLQFSGTTFLRSKYRNRLGKYEFKETTQTFSSPPITIKVKPLPDHPLKEQVAVGTFHLKEVLDSTTGSTGQSFPYSIQIVGNAFPQNFPNPNLARQEGVNFIPSPIKHKTVLSPRFQGIGEFSFQIIPKIPGETYLRDYICWPYFNPIEERYDTLFPKQALSIKGERLTVKSQDNNELENFYQHFDEESNKFVVGNSIDSFRLWANAVLAMLVIALFSLFVFLKGRQRNPNSSKR